MKKLLLINILMLLFTSSLIAQFNSVGYDEKRGAWNVTIHDFIYTVNDNEPTRVICFNLTIENNTVYNLSAIDVEITLKNNGKPFFKKNCQLTISPACGIGEIYDTDSWYFGNPLTRSNFGKKFTWTAKVVACYSPKTN